MLTDYQVRRSIAEDESAISTSAKMSKATREFPNLWTRWDNWARHPPIIAVHQPTNTLAGFHVVTTGTTGPRYANSYYQWVHESHRGLGLAGAMVEFLIRDVVAHGCHRLKFKVPKDSDGERFWKGFGFTPFGYDAKHYLFDLSLSGVLTLQDLMARRETVFDIPDSARARYERSGVSWL